MQYPSKKHGRRINLSVCRAFLSVIVVVVVFLVLIVFVLVLVLVVLIVVVVLVILVLIVFHKNHPAFSLYYLSAG